jgi:hypothetical protein
MNTKLIGFVSVILALVLVPVGVPEAGAETTTRTGFSLPAAQVDTYESDVKSAVSHDLSHYLASRCTPPGVRFAALNNGAGFASAQAGKGDDHFASAAANEGFSGAQAAVFVRHRDPQDRGTVKLNLTVKAWASAGPEPKGPSASTSANWHLWVGYLSREPIAVVEWNTCAVKSADWVSDVLQQPTLFEKMGYELRYEDRVNGGVKTSSGVSTYANGLPDLGLTHQIHIPMTMAVEVASNRSVVLVVWAGAAYGGTAAIDPVVTPHPDNPDVIVEVDAPDGPTGRRPLDGFSAEDLAARGIDPQPFIALGFVDPPTPADTIAPSTTATANPGPNANGWNKGVVTVNLAATDNAGGSGVKEIHTALSGATVGAQVASEAGASVVISAEGATTLTYFAVDNAGNEEAPQTLTVRIDKTAPTLAGLPAAGCSLWPPDHRLVEVGLVTAQDALSGSAGAPVVTVTSNEPATGTGDGDLEPDVLITGGAVQLRAERAGNGTGRVYTITATASDLAGNTASATATCKVPHDRRQTAKP